MGSSKMVCASDRAHMKPSHPMGRYVIDRDLASYLSEQYMDADDSNLPYLKARLCKTSGTSIYFRRTGHSSACSDVILIQFYKTEYQ